MLKKAIKFFVIILILILLLFLLGIGCVFRNFFGIPCPGCGITRAYISFFNGRLLDAFFFHPLFWITVPLVLISIVKKENIFKSTKTNNIFYKFILVIYLTVYLVRMILLFPHTAPMDFNKSALLAPVYQYIFSLFNLN